MKAIITLWGELVEEGYMKASMTIPNPNLIISVQKAGHAISDNGKLLTSSPVYVVMIRTAN